ncbi:hypothetical protein KZZ52_25405 [Dactylosporangium sp. AC04546]|uniref:hypothetical protein n=1 Tax=Dactylosporangium sp. AC04546 TaxID=2862460 RepID=UPI001EDE3279|nr:hypothetical protein [Dactylosporangium sp. AC04546]WVK88609.1 hypothetical protein KZZ52_25405 [Dactylosporangium sp. AC04546]
MLTEYQQQLRERFLSAPVTAPPSPWRPVSARGIAIGGLVGIGFAEAPAGRDVVMVVSHDGHGLFDATTGARIARDREPDADSAYPADADLTCPGLGPVAGQPVRIAGLFGGGLHTTAEGGWMIDVVSPEWPHDRVILSTGAGAYRGTLGETWWHIFDAGYSELRAAGFSPSGRTLAVATSSDLTLWTRAQPSDDAGTGGPAPSAG